MEIKIHRFGDPSGNEYVVITGADDDTPTDDHLLSGFTFKETHEGEIENGHMLPLDYPLVKQV